MTVEYCGMVYTAISNIKNLIHKIKKMQLLLELLIILY